MGKKLKIPEIKICSTLNVHQFVTGDHLQQLGGKKKTTQRGVIHARLKLNKKQTET